LKNLHYADKIPTAITYNGVDVKKVYYNNVLVWEKQETPSSIDGYTITSTVYGTNHINKDTNAKSVVYTANMYIQGVNRFPIEYKSENNKTISLKQSMVKYDAGKKKYLFKTKTYTKANTTYNESDAHNVVQSWLPQSGVDDYSVLKYKNVKYVQNPDVKYSDNISQYSITGTIYGTPVNDNGDKYVKYYIEFYFQNVNKFPIKYISKTGRICYIAKKQVKYDEKIKKYVFITDTYKNDNDNFSEEDAFNSIKAWFPVKGVDGYSTIKYLNMKYHENDTYTVGEGQTGSGSNSNNGITSS